MFLGNLSRYSYSLRYFNFGNCPSVNIQMVSLQPAPSGAAVVHQSAEGMALQSAPFTWVEPLPLGNAVPLPSLMALYAQLLVSTAYKPPTTRPTLGPLKALS